MANNGDKSWRRKMERALEAARSLREDMLKDADQLDFVNRTAKKLQFAFTSVSSVANIAVLVSTGGTLSPAVACATQIGMLAGYGSTLASVAERVYSLWEKYRLDARWQKVYQMLDNPKDMKARDFKTSWDFISLTKDVALAGLPVIQYFGNDQMTTQAETASAKVIPWSVGPLASACYQLANLSTDLYNATPSKTAVFLRECAKDLDKLIKKYEKRLQMFSDEESALG